MSTISKFLAIAALVGGVGGALASQGQQNPCQTPLTQGYGTPLDMTAPPDAPSNSGIQNFGQFGVDFECQESSNLCHYVYEEPSPGSPKQWIPCNGDRQ